MSATIARLQMNKVTQKFYFFIWISRNPKLPCAEMSVGNHNFISPTMFPVTNLP